MLSLTRLGDLDYPNNFSQQKHVFFFPPTSTQQVKATVGQEVFVGILERPNFSPRFAEERATASSAIFFSDGQIAQLVKSW